LVVAVITFAQVLFACNRAMRTRTVGDSIAAQVLLSAYVDQLHREQKRRVAGVRN
jgi:hypothetical protein